MKSFRSTGILFLLVALLAGYTAWDYHRAQKNEGVDLTTERKLLDVRSEDVKEIDVKQKDTTLTLKKTADGWQMTSPVVDEAEDTAVDAFIYSAVIQKGKIFRSDDESKNTKWANFGLEPPGSVVELKTAKGTQSFDVSSKNAFDGSYYVRQNGELLLGDRGLAQLVGRSPNSFRQRRLWRDRTVEVQGAQADIDLDRIHDHYTVVHKGDKWTLDPKPSFPVDEEKVAKWLVAIEDLTPSEIVSDTIGDQEKHDDLLVKPSAQIKLHYKKPSGGGEGDWTLTIGQDKAEDVYLYSTSRPTIYKTTHSSLEQIRVPSVYFRDGHVPFHFNVEEAREIEVHRGGKVLTFKKDGSTWKAAAGEGNLDPDRLVDLIHKITQLDAREFLPAKAAKGFKPEQHVVVRDGKSQVLLDLSWGDGYKPVQPYNKGMTLRYVKTNLEAQAMGVDGHSIDALTQASLMKPAGTSPTKR